MSEILAILEEVRDKYKPVIGLEVHVQLQTQSKVFATEAFAFGSEPNRHISPITLAHPGTLPSINARCIRLAIKMGLATHCRIASPTYFARKNYFYPDLPKGYQLSQAENPICQNGYLEVPLPHGELKQIGIERIHIEEDAGKSIHDQDPNDSLIDLNRSGAGLIEVVTRPDLSTIEEACAFMTEIRKLVRYLGVGDGNMERGNLRCDANVSVMLKDAKQLGTRVEVKNLNSINYLGKVIEYEIKRQIQLIEGGGEVQQATRSWDVTRGCTQIMRNKEMAADYRYFPEPDLQPLVISREELAEIKSSLPLLPIELYEKYTKAFKFSHKEAMALIEQKGIVDYFEQMLFHDQDPKEMANWIMGSVKTYLNEHNTDIADFPISPQQLAAIIQLVKAKHISHTAAKKQLFPAMLDQPEQNPMELAKTLNILMESNESAIELAMNQLIQQFPDETSRYRAGRKGLMGFFVGQIMKQSKGKANPKEVTAIVRQKLDQAD